MSGTVGILNVSGGDIELRFDNKNPAETIRAGRIVKDMLRRGYALLVEVERDGEKAFERAIDFDDKKACYIVADFDSSVAPPPARVEPTLKHQEERDADEREASEEVPEGSPTGSQKIDGRGRYKRTKAVSADGTRAVAVGRSAGG